MKGASLALSYLLQAALVYAARFGQEAENARIVSLFIMVAEFAVLLLALHSLSGSSPSKIYGVLMFPVLVVAGMYFFSASLFFLVPALAK